jgi:adenosylcobinamide kinase/adenosylcobinamide-phosphate guanylyltransferase
MGKLSLVIGGARSGKSTYAQRLAERLGGRILYIATATVYDDEMRRRIAAHQLDRPPGWQTLEAPTDIAHALQTSGLAADTILLDCVTLLVSNLLTVPPDVADNTQDFAVDEVAAQKVVGAEVEALLAAVHSGPEHWIVVTNEVGLGLVPPYTLGRVYRDLLGWANQRLASVADEVYLLVAGIAVPIHPYRD